MDVSIYVVVVGLLALFAFFDLVVGVSNDAVNFLNSSIGSRVAPRRVILFIASIGILVGVLFSSGMMEVARKGIFHPQFFTMPDLMALFLGVMLADVIILDLFNSFGLPTSTTVSIVFELLGAAVVVSLLKIIAAEESILTLGEYINTGKALVIISGILLSVAIAFVAGAIVQFITRVAFTFRYQPQLKRWGGIWGGIVLATLGIFIVLKGAKGATFITPAAAQWIDSHLSTLWFLIFLFSALILQILVSLLRINILKPIVLLGTFALALAFAANDLVNFIGVPLAGLQAYVLAMQGPDPLGMKMSGLAGAVPSQNYLLLLAGLVMVGTLWFSRKTLTVSKTEVSLARQEEGMERFESMALSRVTVRMVSALIDNVALLFPRRLRVLTRQRFDSSVLSEGKEVVDGEAPSFDLVRASVNLMVASAVVSFATTLKLPLSTTYVTFMVAMGTSFADRAWGRDSAVYRVTGVLTVIGGWFFTALAAFCTAAICAGLILITGLYGTLVLLFFMGLILWRNHCAHRGRVEEENCDGVFNLKKVTDASQAIKETFRHIAILMQEVHLNVADSLESLFAYDLAGIRQRRKLVKKVQRWVNIITANLFKAMRLLQKEEAKQSLKYPQTIRCLQSLSDSHRDIILRAYTHVSESHKALLPIQAIELREIAAMTTNIMLLLEEMVSGDRNFDGELIRERNVELSELCERYNERQLERIRSRSSKTRLTILYYAIIGDCKRIVRQVLRLVEVCEETLGGQAKDASK